MTTFHESVVSNKSSFTMLLSLLRPQPSVSLSGPAELCGPSSHRRCLSETQMLASCAKAGDHKRAFSMALEPLTDAFSAWRNLFACLSTLPVCHGMPHQLQAFVDSVDLDIDQEVAEEQQRAEAEAALLAVSEEGAGEPSVSVLPVELEGVPSHATPALSPPRPIAAAFQHNTPQSPPSSPQQMLLLNASPLVLRDGTLTSPRSVQQAVAVSSLEATAELTALDNARQAAACPLRLDFQHLTLQSFSEALSLQRVDILHLSAHGTTINDEFAMVFEGEAGSAQLFTIDQLKSTLRFAREIHTIPRLTLLSCCHSEAAGELFVQAGCRHVIACRATEKIMDVSARHFSKFFYAALFQGKTVQQAFDLACVNVDVAIDTWRSSTTAAAVAVAAPPTRESQKFLLLPAAPGVHDVTFFAPSTAAASPNLVAPTHSPSQCIMSPNLLRIAARLLSRKNTPASSTPSSTPALATSTHRRSTFIPSLPPHFIGRQAEIQQTIGLLRRQRCVNVFGPVRYGKTSVAVAAAHYMDERHRFTDSVFFVDLHHVVCLSQMLDTLATALQPLLTSEDPTAVAAAGAAGLTEQTLFSKLYNKECLIILDGLNSAFALSFVQKLLRFTRAPKYLVTSVTEMSAFGPAAFGYGMVLVRQLPFQACLELVHSLAPWYFSRQHMSQARYKEVCELIARSEYSPTAIVLSVQQLQLREVQQAVLARASP